MFNLKELEKLIVFHRDKYWVDNDPAISDAEYDELMNNLREIDPDNKLLNKIEYNFKFDGEKVNHLKPMLSLEKSYTFKQLNDWINKVSRTDNESFIFSPKYDGLSCRYYKRENILSTRGDGNVGENITSKLPLLEFEILNENSNKNINGEIIIKHHRFNNLSVTKKDGSKYSNPRNFVSGIMNLKFIDHLINDVKLTFIDHKKYTKTVLKKDFNENSWNEVLDYINIIKKTYPVDGIVIELEDEFYSGSLGLTSHHPRSKIAYKFENNFDFSIIEDVVFQTGKRKLTPVAIISPIQINNVTIKRVSLHNAKMLLDNDIHIGDKVKVIRSGDVIPYISSIEKGENRKKIVINSCPYCKGQLNYVEPELYCINENCEGTFNKKLYESIKTLGVLGIGQSTIDKLVEEHKITNIIDVINLNIDNISKKLINGVEDYKILASLNIEGIGLNTSKNILKKFDLKELMHIQDVNLKGLGDIKAQNLIDGLNENKQVLKDMIDKIKVINTKTNTVSIGKICFSGSFPRPKDYYENIAKKMNYEVVNAVTNDLKLLVTSGAATAKANIARNKGIRIIDIEEFLKL
jgi:DNA ligase (NAD+)